MLVSLTIRDFVLIDRLALRFNDGLCVLTGETGAGKSILLDALSLALGARGDSSLVRRGAGDDRAQAVVTAEFSVPDDHDAVALIAESGLQPPMAGEPLALRRSISADGRSRAFVNDQPVGVALLRKIGDTLVEIEGQFASRSLLNSATHGQTLDSFGRLEGQRERVTTAYREWRGAVHALDEAEADAAKARGDEEYLRHVTAELEALDPKPGEETMLAETRTMLQHAEKLAEAMQAALANLTGADGVEGHISEARRTLGRQADKAAGRLDPVIGALDRTSNEAAEAVAAIERAAEDLSADPQRLEAMEERLFALRAAARKHRVDVDALPDLLETYRRQIATLNDFGENLAALAEAAKERRARFVEAAEALSAARTSLTAELDAAVTSELAPLRLEKARFHTVIERLDEQAWSASGIDRVGFEVATNPGTPPGPLDRIASGGELARIMLALKVVLSEANPVSTIVFDEVDSGIGGATAAAVGERLDRLGMRMQVLVVTHSPQVAARGAQHLRVVKGETEAAQGPSAVTRVDELSAPDRQEEIARMIAGVSITDEARAAAAKLMTGHRA